MIGNCKVRCPNCDVEIDLLLDTNVNTKVFVDKKKTPSFHKKMKREGWIIGDEYGDMDPDSRVFLQRFEADKRSAVLEVGSNEENLANILVDNGYRVFGYDLGSIRGCQAPKYKRIQEDFVKHAPIHWYPESFDVVFSTSAIEHFGLREYDGNQNGSIDADYDSKAMRTIHSLLKAKGRCYLTVPYGREFKVNESQGWRQYDKETLQKRIIQDFHVVEKSFHRSEEADVHVKEENGIDLVEEADADKYDGKWPHVTVFLILQKE